MRKLIVLTLLVLVMAPALGVADVYYLTESNALPDGVIYGTVTLTQGDAYTVNFQVDMSTPPLTAGTNFGIQSFGFNTSLLDPVTTGSPSSRTPTSYFEFAGSSDWDFRYNRNSSEFGNFELFYTGPGDRQDPLLFSLQYNPGDGPMAISIADFYVANVEGYHFVAHVADFTYPNSSVNSAWFADGNGNGNTPIPEPGTLMLLGAGLVGIAGLGRRRLRSS